MLKGINKRLSPDLLKYLCEMGHGDELIITDGNFPGSCCVENTVRVDGCGCAEMLDAILEVLPLDVKYSGADGCFFLMDKVPGDTTEVEICNDFKAILKDHQPDAEVAHIERFAFYERAKKVYLSVYTGEEKPYGNIILKKGVVLSD